MNEESARQGNETLPKGESVAIDMKGHDSEEESKTASNSDINSDLNIVNVNTDKNQSKAPVTCTSNENSVDHVKIAIDEEDTAPTTLPNANFSRSDTDSKAEILIDKPLCAGYRTVNSDVDPDSDSDSDTDVDLEYESDIFNSESDTSSPDEATAAANKGGNCENKKKKPDNGDLSMSDLPPIENLKISVPEEECEEIGIVSGIVGTLVIVEAYKNTPAYDIDSVLFLDKGQKTLGKIFDVFGPVCEPVYSVRFNNAEEIKENGIVKGLKVYSAPRTEHTSLVSVSELMKMKGTDASWKNNEEPPPEFQDFSDDEAEERFKNQENVAAKAERPPAPEDRRKKTRCHRPKTNQNIRQEFPRSNPFRMNQTRQPPPNVNINCNNWTPYPYFPVYSQSSSVEISFNHYVPQAFYGRGYYAQGYQRYQVRNYFARYPPPSYPNMSYVYPPTNPFLLPPPGPPPPITNENNSAPVEFAGEPSRPNV